MTVRHNVFERVGEYTVVRIYAHVLDIVVSVPQ